MNEPLHYCVWSTFAELADIDAFPSFSRPSGGKDRLAVSSEGLTSCALQLVSDRFKDFC